MNRGSVVRAALCLVVLLAIPTAVHAQWYKPWTWGRPKPPSQLAIPQVQVPSFETATDRAQPTAQPFAQPVAPLAPTRSPEEEAIVREYVRRGMELDLSCDGSAPCSRERLTIWKMVQLSEPTNFQALESYQRAQADLDRALAAEASSAQAQAAAELDRGTRLNEADRLFRSGDLDGAASLVDGVLAQFPTDTRGSIIRQAIGKAEAARRLRWRLGGVAGIIVVLLVIAFFVGRVVLRRRRVAATEAARERQARRAVLQVLDGVGRGRTLTLDRDMVRIGACEASGADVNDLVLSDADRQISRFHCVIERRDGRFFVLDTSSNGTLVNGRPLKRGEARRLRHGDQLMLARSAHLRFGLA